MKYNLTFNGIVPPIVTPVDSHENVDTEGLKQVIQYVMDGGVHGIFVNGSNGEFYGLDFENQKKAVQVTVEEVNRKIPVYAGASAITTRECIKLAKMAESAGADALTVLTPMFIQPTDQELFDHFAAIAKSCELPIILYNNPGKTNNIISPKLLERLIDIENICGVKNTSMDFSMTMKYIEATAERNDFAVFGGIDYYIYATLCHGGAGSVAGTANVAPRLVVEIYDCYSKGDHLGALNAQKALMPLRDAYGLGTFPVMMKVMLNILGVNAGNPIRPVSYVDDETIKKAEGILKQIELLN
ncbi:MULTISPECIES: dihydrodipicolinate synthase family protein [unclassified Oceanispirochaeta]|uniref:dihydrodipicolinate synthase family protein n=1 Tax=unclassified Oceanispirochaeta TaxID=2635722 RepID=UPI000E0923E3|nr:MULTISPECIES: dihydrodipicolinate synthase family protein [unclassified Oceanispirochaeta]MBF9016881.1 dihydrodipicolinate synthase family protein [Oceanispirochaeta sp. M2]NPD73244.1 dihydrodipicolinate synthase family protein [Oceanispirochaeta sp. M1]RDG31110.1 dihydrodipicolinate synthase family protein [Oceanispirochaeta sp. M1]